MFDTLSLKTSAAAMRIVSVEQDRNLPARILCPSGPLRNRPLIALHGISRDAQKIAAYFAPEAESAGRIIIIPRFSRSAWPVFQRINNRHRADRALLALISDLRMRGVIDTGPVDLFGYSGGAQLAHRFTMLHPEHVADLHLGAAGWFTLPDTSLPYPIGLGPSARGDDRWGRRMKSALTAYLNRRITLYVGTEDNDPDEPALRRDPDLDVAQGQTRLERARRYADLIRDLQAEHDLPETCGLRELPGCFHDFEDCAHNGGLARLVAQANPQTLN